MTSFNKQNKELCCLKLDTDFYWAKITEKVMSISELVIRLFLYSIKVTYHRDQPQNRTHVIHTSGRIYKWIEHSVALNTLPGILHSIPE